MVISKKIKEESAVPEPKVEHKTRESSNKTNTILTIALIILIVVSAIQLFQFSAIKSKMASAGSLSVPVAAGSSASTGSSAGSDLPEMVGGC